MGFFFSKAKNEPKPEKRNTGPRSGAPTNRMKQSALTLNRLGCRACPLRDMGDRIEATIPKNTSIFFLGEAPSKPDEKSGKPLVGKAGDLLREEIPDDFYKRCAFGNIIQHRPPNDREPEFVEIECCRLHVVAEIEKARPKLIVGLGIKTLQWVLGSMDMKGLRGRVFAVQIGEHKCFFMPTYHPTYLMRFAYDPERPLQSKTGHAFRMDLKHAFDIVDELHDPIIVTPVEAKKDIDIFYGDPNSFLGVEHLFDYFARAHKSKKIAIDYETYKIRPYSKDAQLLTVSISFYEKLRDKTKALRTFAFSVGHPKQLWSPSQLKNIKGYLQELLEDKDVLKIAHNVPMELEWSMHEFGLSVVDHHGWGDTMMQAHVIDERKGDGKEDDRRPTYQSLDFLTRLHLGFRIKAMFKLNKKDMRTTNIEDCLVYNGCDSKHTLLLHDIQNKILKRDGLDKVYELSRPRQVTVTVMQRLGLEVDQEENKKIAETLKNEIAAIETEIADMKVIKKFEKDKGEKFNPHSQPHVLEVFKDYLKADLKVETKSRMVFNQSSKSKEVSRAENVNYRLAVDKGVLQSIDHPLAPAIIRLRNRQKLKSTYVDQFTLPEGSIIYPDGKLHTSFNTTFTTSARLSSDDPNLQNFPKHNDKWVRKQVKPKEGHVFVSIDYSQLEWCCACIECKDEVMVDATWTGYDVHMVWAEKIARHWPELIGGKKYLNDPKVMAKARSKVKNKAVFPLIFGAQDKSVAGYLNMPEDIAEDIFKEFWETFHGLGSWQKRLMKGYYDNGYVENKLGRRRRYPMTKNEAINYPIQALGAEIVINAMDRLSELAITTGEMHLHPHLNIHDDLTFIMPNDDRLVEESIDIITREMLALPYDFINVPMGVAVAIGPDWEDMVDIYKINTIDIGRHSKADQKKHIRK